MPFAASLRTSSNLELAYVQHCPLVPVLPWQTPRHILPLADPGHPALTTASIPSLLPTRSWVCA